MGGTQKFVGRLTNKRKEHLKKVRIIARSSLQGNETSESISEVTAQNSERILERLTLHKDQSIPDKDSLISCIHVTPTPEEKQLPNRFQHNESSEKNNLNFEQAPYVTDASHLQSSSEFGCLVKKISGRRIMDFMFVYKQLQDISKHASLFNCGLHSVEILTEKFDGLIPTYILRCSMCHKLFTLRTDEKSPNLNIAAVTGTMAIGCGLSQLQELLVSIELPQLKERAYSRLHDEVSSYWENCAIELMEAAGKKEREAAIREGRVDRNGIAIIDVVTDGTWSKRSYKSNYSALSGAAAVIGARFGEVLFVAVKNKYCCVCDAQNRRKEEVSKPHVCDKNYDGASTGMESAILVEAFKCSIETHKVIYGRIISDGDSSVYSKILQSRPYDNFTVEKIECRNHLLRNFCNKLVTLTTDTKFILRHRRHLTKPRILSMRKGIIVSIKYFKQLEIPLSVKIEKLHDEIIQMPYHALSVHTNCKPHYCNKVGVDKSDFPDIFTSALWTRILNISSNIASHSRSLIYDMDNNVVERFNSIIAKFVGGKRVNFTRKRSYQARVSASVVSFNSRTPLTTLYKFITLSSPHKSISQFENMRKMKVQRNRLYRKPKRRIMFTKNDKNYGENCEKPDLQEDSFNLKKTYFLQNLQKSDSERSQIERDTILQADSSEWLELRRNMITASNFGKIIKKKPYTSCSVLVKNLLYPKNLKNIPSIKHGIENEKHALLELEEQEKISTQQCGLFIDKIIPFLGATPDAICDAKNAVVEIKCPISASKCTLEEAIKTKKIDFWKINKNGCIKINYNCNWYYQVQGQLHITEKSTCIFGVWSSFTNTIKVEYIKRDDQFWIDKMKDPLCKFYENCVLPELIDPRHTRNMKIREPQYILEAMTKKNNKSNTENLQPNRPNEVLNSIKDREERIEIEDVGESTRPPYVENVIETELTLAEF